MQKKQPFKYIFLFLYLITVTSCNLFKKENISLKIKNDSISTWIRNSKNFNISIYKRRQYLDKSYNYILSNTIDSSALKKLSDIAYQTLKVKDTLLFKKRNKKVIELALKVKDSFSLGDAHWNYATYFVRTESYEKAYYHFNEAEKYFKSQKYYIGKMLVGKAFIKGRFSDYIGSEQNQIKAIKIFKELNKYNDLLNSYTSLAVVQSDLKFYDKSLFYYEKALEYSSLSNDKNKINLNNNIGLIYLEKRNYKKALEFFKKDLDMGFKKSNPRDYARVLDNYAYCKLLNKDTLGIKQDFYRALFIRDSLKNKEGVLTSKIHLTKYYKFLNDTLKAKKYASEANKIAKDVKNSRDYLASLKLLASLDIKKSKYYLEDYISHSDSLSILERNYQNKFARISYDTDEYIEETERLSQQKIWITIISLSIILIIILFYFLRVQKAKNEKLLLETEQQKSNEQIYLLTLKQQSKLEEEKVKERNRISEELHDGILGRLFGARVGLGFIEINSNEKNKKQYQLFLDELQNVEKEIRDVSHKLSDNFDNAEINFTFIIKQLVIDKSKIGNFKYTIYFDENINWYKIDGVVKVNLYRIIQEVIQNIMKYANATLVSIKFSLKNNNLVLSLSDDGIGFNVKKKRNGIGLKNIKSRVQKLNGIFEISSSLNKGVEIVIVLPIS
ncbi:ATP-binding protein [Polaribacter sp. Hel_I_88]|uniref:ATP-binding protein n=1 Tax=Polaribacter sp. Hel_I_88 TaxID=1250006 RepID=UPI0018CC0F4B|nr:ATP-binding protein [Polaribacter sp. Hel_I_88]